MPFLLPNQQRQSTDGTATVFRSISKNDIRQQQCNMRNKNHQFTSIDNNEYYQNGHYKLLLPMLLSGVTPGYTPSQKENLWNNCKGSFKCTMPFLSNSEKI